MATQDRPAPKCGQSRKTHPRWVHGCRWPACLVKGVGAMQRPPGAPVETANGTESDSSWAKGGDRGFLTHRGLASHQMAPWLSGCSGPNPGNAWWCETKRFSRQSAGSRPTPPGNLVPCQPMGWQQLTGSRIIEAPIMAREVIPQPKLQPSVPQETRRCRQFAPSSRAPCKPFFSLFPQPSISLPPGLKYLGPFHDVVRQE